MFRRLCDSARRLVCIGALAVAVTGVPSFAQNDPTTTIRSGTELVLVPTIVTNDKVSVPNLRKSDFIVREDGVEQPLAIFEEVSVTGPAVPPKYEEGVYSNSWQSQPADRRVTIIVLDLYQNFSDMAYSRFQLLKYLASAPRLLQPTALLLRGARGLEVVHDFTDDPSTLIAAINSASIFAIPRHHSEPTPQVPQLQLSCVESCPPEDRTSKQIKNESRSLDAIGPIYWRQEQIEYRNAFREIASAASGIPGQKSLIWISDHFPESFNAKGWYGGLGNFNRFLSFQAYSPKYLADQRADWQVLNDARVALYPIDSSAMRVVMPGIGNMLNYDHAQDIAAETGGKAAVHRDIGEAIREASQDMEHYYLLGYYRPRRDEVSRWHKLDVRVTHSDAKVRARTGFFSSAREQSDAARDLELAFTSPLQFTGLPMAVRARRVADASLSAALEYSVTMPVEAVVAPGERDTCLDISAEAVDARGNGLWHATRNLKANNLTDEALAKLKKGGLTFNSQLVLPPDTAKVRVVVVNRLTSHVGSVDVPLPSQ